MQLYPVGALPQTRLCFTPFLLSGLLLITPARMLAQTQGSLTVQAWGSASRGQIGDGSDSDRHSPAPVALAANIRAISAGSEHSLALKVDGTVWAWGFNASCQTGKKDALYLTLPAKVGGLAGCKSVAAGASHSLALKADGTVWAWGGNTFGQLGNGTATSRFASYSKAHNGPDGRPEPTPVKNLTDVVAIAAGNVHSLALASDGRVWAWGRNVWGELGTGANKLTQARLKSIARSQKFMKSIGLKMSPDAEAGDVNCPIPVEGISQITAIAAGSDTSFAIGKDGTLWNWGVVSRKPSAGGSFTYSAIPVQIKEVTHAVAVAPGATHTLALASDGVVWAWGSNYWGELGDGTLKERETPLPVPGLSHIVAIAAGNGHSVALDAEGRVWTWGYNANGELGIGKGGNRLSPTLVPNLTQAVAVSAGECYCLSLARSTTPSNPAPQPSRTKVVRAEGADAHGAVVYKTYYEVDPFHWSHRAIWELRGNNVIPLREDRYLNLIKRDQYALNIQRGLEYSVLGKTAPDGTHFPVDDPQSLGHVRRGGRSTLWPEEARLMLRLLREYRPDVETLWKQSNRDMGELAEAEQRLVTQSRETPALQTPVAHLKMTNAAVEEVYTELVQNYHLPLSLIEAPADTRVSIDVQAGTAQDVLDQLTAQAAAYQLKTLHGRLILMPAESRFATILTEPTFAGVTRVEATRLYCDYLSKNVQGFAGLSAPLFIAGDIHAPILTEPITLRGKTTVLERFVQLLGKTPRACFYIHRHLKYPAGDVSLFYINLAPRAVEEF